MSKSQKQTVTENIEMIRVQVGRLLQPCSLLTQRENKVRGAEVQSLKAQVSRRAPLVYIFLFL